MPQRMVRAGGSMATTRLITMVRVSQRAVTCAWSVAHGGAAVGADGDSGGLAAERGAVEAVHGAASSAG